MEKTYITLLAKLGINHKNKESDILIDLLNVSEYLYDQLEEKEMERFRAELERIKKPTN